MIFVSRALVPLWKYSGSAVQVSMSVVLIDGQKLIDKKYAGVSVIFGQLVGKSLPASAEF